jgi:hypothetical protein
MAPTGYRWSADLDGDRYPLTSIFQAQEMRDLVLPSGPGPDAVIDHITATYPDADVVSIPGWTFFSLDPERHFPNFATLGTEDDAYDTFSNLSRAGVFRLNIGVGRATAERVAAEAGPIPDYTLLDRLLPHPVYAAQRWVCILNPGVGRWESVVKPLIAEAYERLASQRARHRFDPAAEREPQP